MPDVLNAAWYASLAVESILLWRLFQLRLPFPWFKGYLAANLLQALFFLIVVPTRSTHGYGALWASSEPVMMVFLCAAAIEACTRIRESFPGLGRFGQYLIAGFSILAAIICYFSIGPDIHGADWERPVLTWALLAKRSVSTVAAIVLFIVAVCVTIMPSRIAPNVRTHAKLLCGYLGNLPDFEVAVLWYGSAARGRAQLVVAAVEVNGGNQGPVFGMTVFALGNLRKRLGLRQALHCRDKPAHRLLAHDGVGHAGVVERCRGFLKLGGTRHPSPQDLFCGNQEISVGEFPDAYLPLRDHFDRDKAGWNKLVGNPQCLRVILALLGAVDDLESSFWTKEYHQFAALLSLGAGTRDAIIDAAPDRFIPRWGVDNPIKEMAEYLDANPDQRFTRYKQELRVDPRFISGHIHEDVKAVLLSSAGRRDPGAALERGLWDLRRTPSAVARAQAAAGLVCIGRTFPIKQDSETAWVVGRALDGIRDATFRAGLPHPFGEPRFFSNSLSFGKRRGRVGRGRQRIPGHASRGKVARAEPYRDPLRLD